jgi:hypothetical protein
MNKDKVDEAVLALLYLNHWLEKPTGVTNAWKSFDWDTMERLHERGLISNPVAKSKVVAFSDEGLRKAKEAFAKLFEEAGACSTACSLDCGQWPNSRRNGSASPIADRCAWALASAVSQIDFFALPEDWPVVINAVSEKAALHIAQAGRFPTPELRSFERLSALPNLGEADGDQTAKCAAYLISLGDQPIRMRKVDGVAGEAFVVDELENRDAVTFTPAGRWQGRVIIRGTLGSAHDTPKSTAILKLFRSEVSRHFRRVKGFWVGEVASSKWKDGYRLTIATHSPAEFDLTE